MSERKKPDVEGLPMRLKHRRMEVILNADGDEALLTASNYDNNYYKDEAQDLVHALTAAIAEAERRGLK